MEELDLVKLAEVSSPAEANMVKGFLAEHDVDVMIKGLDSSAFGDALDGPDAIEIFIQRADYDNANELLRELIEGDDQPIPAWTCQCGEEVDEGFFVCWSCGQEYELKSSEGSEPPEQGE